MSWDGPRTTLKHNQRISELIEDKRDHLERNYSGPTNFFEEKLEEEDTLDLDQKIEREKRHIKERYQELEELLREKSEQDLEDKKQELQRKRNRLEEAKKNGAKSVDEFRKQYKKKLKEHGNEPEGEDEEMLEKAVQNFKENSPDIDQLQKEVEALEKEVQELQPESISLNTSADFLED